MLTQIGSDLAGSGEREQWMTYVSEGETGPCLGEPWFEAETGLYALGTHNLSDLVMCLKFCASVSLPVKWN